MKNHSQLPESKIAENKIVESAKIAQNAESKMAIPAVTSANLVKFPIWRKLIVLTVLPVCILYCVTTAIQLHINLKVTEKKASRELATSVTRYAKECEITFATAAK
ncbi:MAG: hypothetical protein LBP87_03160, partial [Planctomycetaceae bacterium]|nr:hypothetical protein [Planctomycetaceae bacterium]